MSYRLFTGTLTASSVLFTAAVAAGQDEAPASEFRWPAYQTQRFKEDYSALHRLDEVPARDWFDRIKYVPLNEQGDIWLSFGGQARLRYEGVRNFRFRPGVNDNFHFLQRYFLWSSLNIGPDLRVFVEAKSAWVHDRDLPGGRRTLDHDEFDIQNAFAEWRSGPDRELGLFVRAGRQELLYGRQRLISPLDWSNTRRSWEGAVGQVSGENWTADLFWARFVPVRKYDFNRGDSDHRFWGVYSTINKPADLPLNMDAYFLGRHLDDAVGLPGSDSDRYTAGGRLWGPIGATGFTGDLEGAYQFGKDAGRTIDAFFAAGEIVYAWADHDMKPSLALGGGYASGDGDPADGRARTFNHLYPLGHAWLGYVDVIGRQNIIDLRITGRIEPMQRLWVQLDYHNFWRARRADALYDAGGNVVFPGAADSSRYVGSEIDLTVGWAFDHHTSLLVGYSRFFRGRFITENRGKDIDFWYTQLTFTF
jgi:hypothetical protein